MKLRSDNLRSSVERIAEPVASGNRRARRAMPAAVIVVAVAAAMFAAALPAAGQQDRILGQFRDWYARSWVEDGARSCDMYSKPTSEEGNYTRRDATYVQVARGPGIGSDVVSIEAGYPYREGSHVEVRIDGGDPFMLFTDGETAWAWNTAEDRALVAAMARGKRMVVKGTSRRGTLTTDTYSLLGFTAARAAVADACDP